MGVELVGGGASKYAEYAEYAGRGGEGKNGLGVGPKRWAYGEILVSEERQTERKLGGGIEEAQNGVGILNFGTNLAQLCQECANPWFLLSCKPL
jgi:hypothetical protein